MTSPIIFFFVLSKQKPVKGSCMDGDSWVQEMGFITNPGGIRHQQSKLVTFFFLMEHDFREKQKGSRFYRPHRKSDIPALGNVQSSWKGKNK